MGKDNVIEVWTDGGINNKKKIGAYAFCLHMVRSGETVSQSGIVKNATSQIAELTAIEQAMQFCFDKGVDVDKFEFKVYSDSQYLVKGMNQWLKRWVSRNWKKPTGETIANKEIWQRLYELKNSFPSITFTWVKGHAGIELNEHVDSLCQKQLRRLK